ncbi:MAG: hypothetical protein E7658_10315 [Ruminococcaceae bacterium]|nr:hypothetical protein [Oscillospiraceae bacterium]
MEHDYLIAGLRVRMDSFGRTLSQAEPYLTHTVGDADITITSDPQSLKEQQPHLSLDDCEYLCTGGNFYRQLLDFGGMMLHSSAVVMDGYLLSNSFLHSSSRAFTKASSSLRSFDSGRLIFEG